jgi:8-oxo-dGTP diphosphatase
MVEGCDYIGVGVGALVFNKDHDVFLARRGPRARNEQGYWEFPGGSVAFGEGLAEAVVREFMEEFGIQIKIVRPLGVVEHFVQLSHHHWISCTFVANHIAGTPHILEPGKCTAIGWYALSALPAPLSSVSKANLHQYLDESVSSLFAIAE